MSDSVPPAERLLDLVIALTHTRHRMTRSDIRRMVRGYDASPSDEAFERMFERDKEQLRSLGIPIVTLTDAVHEDDVGYRIDTSAYELPPVEFTPAEVGVLSLAAGVWQDSSLSTHSRRGLTKLRAVTDVGEPALHAGLALRLRGPDEAFGSLLDAIGDRIAVRFTYRAANTGVTAQRTVEPWRLFAKDRGWYLVGHDRDRGERRQFRLSRIVGRVTRIGEPGDVTIPSGDLDGGDVTTLQATLALRPERASALRARAVPRTQVPDGAGPDRDVVTVEVTDLEGFAEELAGYADAVLVLDPPELREAVLRRLRAAAALAPGGDAA